MNKQQVLTPNAPSPAGSYSQAVISGGFVYTAGFGPQDPVTGEVPKAIAEQTRQVLRNIDAALREAGATLDDVVKTTAHLQHVKRDFADYNRAYAEFFTTPYPVRTTVGSDLMDILVEIDVIAKLPSRSI